MTISSCVWHNLRESLSVHKDREYYEKETNKEMFKLSSGSRKLFTKNTICILYESLVNCLDATCSYMHRKRERGGMVNDDHSVKFCLLYLSAVRYKLAVRVRQWSCTLLFAYWMDGSAVHGQPFCSNRELGGRTVRMCS